MYATLSDLVKINNLGKPYPDIIEYQKQTNQILEDAIWGPSTEGGMCESVLRTSLPEVAWRMINKGVTPGKSSSRSVTFTSGGVEALAKVDERLLQKYGGPNSPKAQAWRLGENQAYQQSMNNKMALTTFFGDEKTNPAGFTGLGAYYYDLTASKCAAAGQIIDAGGSGSNLTSIWLIGWGQNSMHYFYPEGMNLGFRYLDNGRTKSYDSDNGELYVYESQYNWDMGLVVRDYRYGVRIANIDANDTTLNYTDLLIDAMGLMQDENCKMAIYCNRKVWSALNKYAANKSNLSLSIDEFGGKKITHFWGTPIRRCDALNTAEDEVVAS